MFWMERAALALWVILASLCVLAASLGLKDYPTLAGIANMGGHLLMPKSA
jgi:hypothetical protein